MKVEIVYPDSAQVRPVLRVTWGNGVVEDRPDVGVEDDWVFRALARAYAEGLVEGALGAKGQASLSSIPDEVGGSPGQAREWIRHEVRERRLRAAPPLTEVFLPPGQWEEFLNEFALTKRDRETGHRYVEISYFVEGQKEPVQVRKRLR